MDTVDNLLVQWGEERPDLDISALGISVRVDILAKHWQRATSASLKTLGLKLREYEVLAALRRQGEPYQMPATMLAKSALLSPGAMTIRIDQLEKKKWVKRRVDPTDGRGVLIGLTQNGLKLIERAIETRINVADQAVSSLSNKQRRDAEVLLRKLMSSH
jgi:DNA-binding MarR family transcriptional regulator